MASRMEELRDRWENLSERERRLVIALGISFVFVLLAWTGLRIGDGLHAIEKRNARMRKALSALHQYRMSDTQQPSQPEVEIGKEPVRLETYLSGVADEVGIKIPGFNPLPATTRDDFTETSTRIEIRDLTIVQLKDFLEKVESKSRVVVVKSLNVRRHFRDKDKLDVNMVVSTYSKAASEGEGEGKGEGGSEGGGEAKDQAGAAEKEEG